MKMIENDIWFPLVITTFIALTDDSFECHVFPEENEMKHQTQEESAVWPF